jgi:hypothetical protein
MHHVNNCAVYFLNAAGASQWAWDEPPPPADDFESPDFESPPLSDEYNYTSPSLGWDDDSSSGPSFNYSAFNYSGYPDWFWAPTPPPSPGYNSAPPASPVYWDPSTSTNPYLGYNASFFYNPETPYWTTSQLANGTSAEGRYSVAVDVKSKGESRPAPMQL